MARTALDERIVISHTGFLRGLRQAIDVGHEANDRLSFSPGRNPDRGHARNAALNLEFLFLQNLCDELGGLRFLESQLGKAENRIDHHLGGVFAGIDTPNSFGFHGIQRWNLS